VTVGFTLIGDCNGTGPCRLTALTGSWGWSLTGGSSCMTNMGGGAYQVSQGVVSATFTLAPADHTIGAQAVVPQSALPLTAVITDLHATRVGDAPVEPVGCA
jgi:hypothetical protein